MPISRNLKALSKAATHHRRRHHTILKNARLEKFGSAMFSHDRRFLLYHAYNRTTQHGTHELDKSRRLLCTMICCVRLMGWDFTHVFILHRPPCHRKLAKPKLGQQLCPRLEANRMEFQRRSRHSSPRCRPRREGVDVPGETSGLVSQPGVASRWATARFMCCKDAYIWRPSDGLNDTITLHCELDNTTDRYRKASVQAISKMNEGRLIALGSSEGTKVIYDTQTTSSEVVYTTQRLENSAVGCTAS
jgi:hypothetical protein